MHLLSSPLPPNRQQALLDWLASPSLDIAVEVIKSRIFRLEFEAMDARAKSEGGKFPDYDAVATEKARAADTERAMIAVLTELSKTQSFETVTARPD